MPTRSGPALSATLLVLGAAELTELRSWDEAERLAEEKLQHMSTWERARLLRGVGWQGWHEDRGYYIGQVPGQAKHGIPWLRMSDSGNGYHNLLPGAVGTSVVWPCALAQASTWDDASVEELAKAIGEEFRGKSANVILGPGLNVNRVARGGRNWEYLSGEDPYLGARLGRAFVRGVQSNGLIAVMKHYAFNEQENGRHFSSSDVDDRTAWELYYPPFEAAVDEGIAGAMCGYNRVNGTFACSNWHLLERDLREKMGFRGFAMSDWGAVDTWIGTGLDMDMPGFSGRYLPGALVHEPHLVTRSAKRVLSSMYRVRLDEERGGCHPPHCFKSLSHYVATPAHRELARRMTASSITLLKNSGGILPFERTRVKRLAVLGHAATEKPASWWAMGSPGLQAGDEYSGGGSGHESMSFRFPNCLEKIRSRAEFDGIEVVTPKGKALSAVDADAFIVLATRKAIEDRDRPSLRLFLKTEHLIERAAKTGKPVVVLMMLPGAVLMPWHSSAAAILNMFYGGEATADAWAAVLFGDQSPEGRLPIMMPHDAGDAIPPHWGPSVHYLEREFTSYRSNTKQSAYPFGFGLSYTSFIFEGPEVSSNSHLWERYVRASPTAKPAAAPGRRLGEAEAAVTAKVCIVNVGKRAGKEVVQAYLKFPQAPPKTPKLRLSGFQKTGLLQPGSRECVTLHFGPRDLSIYTVSEGWRVHAAVSVCLGASSEDLKACLPVALTSEESLVREFALRDKPDFTEEGGELPATWHEGMAPWLAGLLTVAGVLALALRAREARDSLSSRSAALSLEEQRIEVLSE